MAAIGQMARRAKKVLKKFYDKNTIRRIALTVLVALLLIYVFCSIPAWTLKSQKLAQIGSRQPSEGTSIAQDAGKVVVAEKGGRRLSIDTAEMIIEVKDIASGYTFSSAARGTTPGELALLSLAYLGENNNLYEWDSYTYSTLLSSYSLYQIADGVRIDLNLNEGEPNRFYEIMPRKMGIETYEEFFVGGLNGLMENGQLDRETGEIYLNALSVVYHRGATEECYSVIYNGNPPASATRQLTEVTKLLGYTKEMLLEDADKFGFVVTFTEPAKFDLSVEITLEDNGDLKVHVPGSCIVSHNDFYTAQSLSLLPNFGAVTVDQYEEGYIMVPDGSGALVEFNSYIPNVAEYKRPYYDSDFFSDFSYMPEYAEELYLPVYGMMYGAGEEMEKGFLAIAEEGARTAYLNVKLASKSSDSAKYNKAYNSFEVSQYKRVKINGEYSSVGGTYLVNAGVQDVDFTLRYQFYGRGVTYYEMAKGYQAYLAEQEGLSPQYGDGAAQMYLEVVGGLNIVDRFVGIPYQKAYSMTSYVQLRQMMEELNGLSYSMQYNGAFNGGWNGEMNRGGALARQNGRKSGLEEVIAYAESQGVPLYLQVALSQVWQQGNSFRASQHAVRDYSNEVVKLSRYQPVLGILNGALSDGMLHDGYNLVSPRYLGAVTDAFLKEAGSYGNLAVSDLAGMYYADYRYRGYVSGETGNRVLEENLAKLSADRQLTLTNPHIDKIGYGGVATDISRESSDYATFAVTIPFKQLVMNGLIAYTTENVNLSSRDSDYFILQAAELGSRPKFLLTWENVDVLQHSDFNYLFSAQFSLLKEKIRAVYEECAAVRGRIGTDEIAGHKVLADGVYQTTYANGVIVLVNYNLYDVTLADGTQLPAEGYLIKEGK